MNHLNKIIASAVLMLLTSHGGHAAQRIAVLDFELSDITSLPKTPAERQRTASMAPLLIRALSRSGDYEIMAVDAGVLKSANLGFGYLFRFHDLAAQLGRQLGADWIVVSQHSKPSFLFSYLLANLIDVKAQTLAARYDIELKGNHERVTHRGISRLADEIHETLDKHGTAMPTPGAVPDGH